MKKFFYLVNLILLAILSSCSVKEDIARDVSVSYPVFRGIMEAPGGTSDTRAFADEALHVYWHKYDKASMFYDKTFNREYEYQGRDGTTAGEFTRYGSDPSSFSEVEIESGYNYAIFPYNYRSVNGDFMFKHTAGYVGLKLYGEGVTVSSVEFVANNNEPITGYPYVVFNEDDEPFLSFDQYSEAGSKVTLACDPPVELGATAAEAKTDTNGGTFSKRRSSNYVVERKVFKTMSAFEVVPEGGSDTPTVVPVTGVQLGSSSLSLEVGGSANLMATVLPSNATDKSVSWSSSNSGVATVDNNGKVTAVAAGSAVITVTTTDGGKTATCTVTVTNPAVPVQSVSLNKTELSLNVGESVTLTATVLPENADNKAVTWSSSDAAVATVDSNGKVSAVAAGSAVITVKTTDGEKTATCTVTVIADKDPNHAGDPVEIEEGGDL